MSCSLLGRMVLATGLAVCWGAALAAAPYTPTADDEVLEVLPGSARDADLGAVRALLAAGPATAPDAATVLARRLIERGRASADPRLIGYAQAVLAPWWSAQRPPPQIWLLRASIRQSEHAFADAIADLDALLARHPDLAQGWLTLAVIHQVQGRFAQAGEACTRMRGRVDPLVVAVCAADVGLRTGADSALMPVLAEALADAVDPAVRRWGYTVLAEAAAARGETAAAGRWFEQALAESATDAYLLGAYADHLLATDQAAAVLALIDTDTRVDGLLLRRALAHARLGHRDAQVLRRQLEDRFAEARLRGNTVHRREQAIAELWLFDDPTAALETALANFAVQREHWDVRLVLEAALALGRPGAARPVIDWVAESGFHDLRVAALIRRLQAQPS